MQIDFQVGKFSTVDGKLEQTGMETYRVEFMATKSTQHWQILVEGRKTVHRIDIISHKSSFREPILLAISDYVNGRIKDKSIYKKHLMNRQMIDMTYSQKIRNLLLRKLMPIKKENNVQEITTGNENSV